MLKDRFYTVKEMAAITSISGFTLRKLIRDGKLRTACKRGLNYMISLENMKDLASKYTNYYSFITNIISNDKVSLEYEAKNQFKVKNKKNKTNEVLSLKIRIKELEIKLLKYESKYGPLEWGPLFFLL